MAYVTGHVRYLSSTDERRKLYDNGFIGSYDIVVINGVQWRVWFTGKFESIDMGDQD